jgi:hypothetical protein
MSTEEASMVKRVYITFDDEQYQIIKSVKGHGTKDAEIVKNIVTIYLSEKGYIQKYTEQNNK